MKNEKHGGAEAKYDAFTSLKRACQNKGKLLINESIDYEEPACTWASEGLQVTCEVKATADCLPDPDYVDLTPKKVAKPVPKKPVPKPVKKK